MRDITNRKEAEEALQDSETRYRRLFETAKDGILLLDAETGMIVDVNPFLIEMLGLSHEQIVGKAIWEIGSFKDIAPNKNKFTELQQKGYVRYEDLPLETADGRKIEVEFVSNIYAVDHKKVIQCNIRDITERKQAEEAVKKSEALFRTTLYSIGDGVIITDKQGRVQYLNPVAEELTGWKEDDAKGKPLEKVFNIINEEVRNKVENPVLKVFKEGIVVGLANHTLLVSKDGRETPVTDSGAPIKSETGEIIGVVLVFRDQTEERKAQRALQEAREFAVSIVATVREPLIILDGSLKVIYANRSFYDTFKTTSEETEGVCFCDLGNNQWKIPKLRELLEKIIPENTAFEDFEVEHDFPTIGRQIMMLNARRIYKDANKTQTILLAIENITDRKRAEEMLNVSEVRYRRLFETAKDGILILNAKTGMIVDVNPFLIEMLGFSYEQIAGKTIWEIGSFKDIASNKKKFMELQKQKYVRYEDLPLETADGRRIEVEFVSNVYTVDHQKVIQCNIRDITERKRAEEEIAEKRREAIQMKLEFISMVSHELRTPLTVIKEGIALVTNGSTGEINEEQKELLGLSKKNVDRLAKFINDVLDFQKLEANRMKINAQPNDINEIVRDVYEMMNLGAKNIGIDILLELDDRLPTVGFDNDKITQVLTNLVDNAVKFTKKGNIVIKTSEENGMIHVSVSDTGCGIKKKNISRSFGRFEQLSTGGDRKTGGTGLGLAICKGIIEQHNGKIWVDSVFGKGSKFAFTLPIYDIKELYRKYINDGIKEASTNDTRMSLVLISMGDFYELEQKLSHEKITSTLKDMKAILENDLHRKKGRPNQVTDTVFRFSNEFLIVLTNCSKENVQVVKERLEQKLNDYLAGKNLADKIGLFFGCVTYPDDAVTSEELIKKAEELHPVVSTVLSV